jgi:hypothetical protein
MQQIGPHAISRIASKPAFLLAACSFCGVFRPGRKVRHGFCSLKWCRHVIHSADGRKEAAVFIPPESMHGRINRVIGSAIETGNYSIFELDGETVYAITGIKDFGSGITGHVGVTRDAVYIAARTPEGDFDRQQARNLLCQKNQWQQEALEFADQYVAVPPDAPWRELPLETRRYLKNKMSLYLMFDPFAGKQLARRIREAADRRFPGSPGDAKPGRAQAIAQNR